SKPAKSLVYLEFEESLPSRNTLDLPNTFQNDMAILQGVIGSSVPFTSPNGVKNFVSNGLTMSPTTTGLHMGPEASLATSNFNRFHVSPRLQPVIASSVQQQPQAFTLGSPLSNHSNPEQFMSNLANMHISPTNTANVYTSPLSSMSARNISAPNLQGEMQRDFAAAPSYSYERRPSHQQHIIPPTLPTRPPKEAIPSSSSTSYIEEESDVDENDPNSEMIKQLINIGFSKAQAIDA
ncbi:14507_t:CDS:1, partial [Racocetra fulgida]